MIEPLQRLRRDLRAKTTRLSHPEPSTLLLQHYYTTYTLPTTSIMPFIRQCNTCHQWKPSEEFYRTPLRAPNPQHYSFNIITPPTPYLLHPSCHSFVSVTRATSGNRVKNSIGPLCGLDPSLRLALHAEPEELYCAKRTQTSSDDSYHYRKRGDYQASRSRIKSYETYNETYGHTKSNCSKRFKIEETVKMRKTAKISKKSKKKKKTDPPRRSDVV